MSPKQIIEAYTAAAHKVQSAIAILMVHKAPYAPVQPKHLRVGVDMSKADMKGLARLLIEKGVFTEDEYLEAVLKSAEEEAADYERLVREELANSGITLG